MKDHCQFGICFAVTILLVLCSLATCKCFADDSKMPDQQSGLLVDSRDFSTLSAAVAMATNGTLAITRPETLDRNIVVPQETHLLFSNGGSIAQSSNHKVTINGPVTAPISHVFSGFKPGEVTLGSGFVREVYPQWWGAKADGVTDDGNAIQCALNSSAKDVFFLKGRYLFSKPLDVTNRAGGVNLKGQGMSEDGSVLVANTDTIAVDATGSRYMLFRDLRIASGESHPSTVGILFARSKTVPFVEFNTLENVAISLKTIAAANNGNGTIGVYNNASELWRARNIYFIADKPIVFTGYNIYKVESPFTERDPAYVSMSQCTIDGASTLHAHMGPAVTLENAVGIEILNTYIAGTHSVPNRFLYALKITGIAYNITFTGHDEGFGRILYTDSNIVGLSIRATTSQQGPLVYLDGTGAGVPGILTGRIDIMPMGGNPQSVIETAGNQNGVRDCTVYLYGGQNINAPGGWCTGNTVYTDQPNPSVLFSASPGMSSYTVCSRDGIAFFGSVSGKE